MKDSLGVRSAFFRQVVILAISGVIAAFCLMIPILAYFVLVILVPLILFLSDEKKLIRILIKNAVFVSFYFGTIYVYSLVEFLHFILSVLLFSLFALLIYLEKRYFQGRFYFFLAPIFFVLTEYFHVSLSYIPTYVAVIGNGLASSVFLGLAKFVGYWGLSFFTVGINALIAYFLKYKKLNNAGIACLVLLAAIGISTVIGPAKGYNKKIDVALFSVFDSERPDGYMITEYFEQDDAFLDDYLSNSRISILKNAKGAELIMFPSNVFDTERKDDLSPDAYKQQNISNNGMIIDFFGDIARENGSETVFGVSTNIRDDNYISLVYTDDQGSIKGRYDKYDLVIGSEYWPFGNWVPFYWRWLGDYPEGAVINVSPGYSRSKDPYSIVILDKISIMPLICSESHDPANFSLAKKKKAQAVYATTNNDWYFALNLKYYLNLHLNILRINSAASGLPVIVNGKNNYAGLIYPDGRMEINNFWEKQGDNYSLGDLYWRGALYY